VRHLFAALLTLAADLRTSLHRLVPAPHALAILGTSLADVRAQIAELVMIFAQPAHKIRMRDAGLSAILQNPLMLRGCMLASQHQAVRRRFQADRMALQAQRNALPHFTRHLM
jgi:hypothetical protein